MSSSDGTADKERQRTASEVPKQAQATESAAVAVDATPMELLTEDGEVEADDGHYDSGFGTDNADTTSISSSIYKGYVENGRRYQTTREGEYFMPSDEKQFESLQAAHIVYSILDSQQKNPLFRSPISETAQNILDIGTGNGAWAIDVADRYPAAFVQGIDLYPPPDTWVPSNCKFEVDDVLKSWVYGRKFDLIHMRDLQGSFSEKQWTCVYKQAYQNLVPGGWFEVVDASVGCYSDDGTLRPDSLLANSGSLWGYAAEKAGKPLDSIEKSKSRIAAAGFTNIQEKLYKVPLGGWAKNPTLKEVGRFCKTQMLDGMEGYSMFLFTKFGEPEPWSPAEVHIYLAKLRKEIETPGLHAYYLKRRVWAQKPLDAEE